MTPLLSVTDLHVTLDTRNGPVEVIRGLSFSIGKGETLGFVGESGSGKSITAMSLVGLAPPGTSLRISGKAVFDGADLLALGQREMRAFRGKRIGVVFQDPAAALNPLMNAGDHIREALPSGLSRADAYRRVGELLAEVGLADVPNVRRRYAHELSGGQQQRVVIASALAGDPDLLIADEPTTALDMSVQAQILELLHSLQQARGMAMLLITHDLGVVSKYSRRVVVLQRGTAMEAGPTASVLGAPRHDYTRMLLQSRPRLVATAAASSEQTRDDILSVSDLSVSYPGQGPLSPRIQALDAVDFALRRGDALAIVGESGSGKSTLGKVLVGLVGPDRGRIRFQGRELRPARMTTADRQAIQYIFQDSYGALNPRLNVEQALTEPLAIYGKPRRTWRDEAVRLLEEVDLGSHHLTRYPGELSGGQRQRVNIARALAVSPELLICDEIVSALDVTVQAQVLDLLSRLRLTRRLSLIFISHDLAVVGALCNRTLVMRNARVIEEAPTCDILTAPLNLYTRSLVNAAQELAPAASSSTSMTI
ncbi:ABC transporter ATP-binding protein [Devosia alba]|uniref:ABC transporter ATP-binding protein n=1 Tax=Devosia alba TaxID=3152360 RepID=UPI00326358CD